MCPLIKLFGYFSLSISEIIGHRDARGSTHTTIKHPRDPIQAMDIS